MISWSDEGPILSSRPHGETSVIVEVFCAGHGRHAGVVRGGASRKIAPSLQPGAQVSVTWKARLEDHLGSFLVEPIRSRAAVAMSGRLPLAGLNAVCSLLAQVLPERAPYPDLYLRSVALLDLLDQPELWPLAYLRWEQLVLEEMGFGLDLSSCAVSGQREGLIYVSPRSGRAVSSAGAGDWADRMLPLPPVLRGEGDADTPAVLEALATTGFFMEHRLVKSLTERPITAARARLLDVLGTM